MPRRLTNDLLLALVLALVLTGLFGWALPVSTAQPLYDAHRALGVAVLIVLAVWKQAVIRASLARRWRRDRSVLWSLSALVALVLGVGIGVAWTLNLISFATLWGYSPINIHVIVGVGLLPFVGWHALGRRKPNRVSAPVASRRAMLRLAGLTVVSIAGWQVMQQAAGLLTMPGVRRETGSKFAAALSNNAYPAEIWLFDSVPALDASTWRMHVGGRTLSLDDLQTFGRRQVRAVLDCTGGWWTDQVWSGTPLMAVLPAAARSIAVESVTGHRIELNVSDLHEAILATHVGDEPLSAVHGYPLRLVVPGQRGFHWVKWVARIDVTG